MIRDPTTMWIRTEQFDQLVSMIPDPGLMDLVLRTWEACCRPPESPRVEAGHVDPNSVNGGSAPSLIDTHFCQR